MAVLVNTGMNCRVPDNVGNCWTEDRFASGEGLCSVALVRLVSLVSLVSQLV
jgi:hypothetical protein